MWPSPRHRTDLWQRPKLHTCTSTCPRHGLLRTASRSNKAKHSARQGPSGSALRLRCKWPCRQCKWSGEVAFLTTSLSCCAIVRDTNFEECLRQQGAVRWPRRCAHTRLLMRPFFAPTVLAIRGLPKRGRKCSTVIPDGPRGAPLRADRTFFANASSSNPNVP